MGVKWQNIQITDIATGDDIERIRHTRNELQHSKTFKLEDKHYNDLCNIIADLLKRFDQLNNPAKLYTEQLKEILDRTLSNEEVTGVQSDFSKALGKVLHNERLLFKIGHYGIRRSTVKWLRNFLLDRQQFVLLEEESSKTSLVQSIVQQGSMLGPKKSSVTSMLHAINWKTLQERRAQFNAIMFDRVMHELIAVPSNKKYSHQHQQYQDIKNNSSILLSGLKYIDTRIYQTPLESGRD
ncbi:unnamed protein product [Mytilus edulis]|uniref:DZIP3-like HEPN domain-containing protein n=1 Tax=Mytilus edulis TaxID=6550 RepID=A0A8S3T5L8_MYTED|nr:unnamed protein product [Mytilus edulis]